MREALAFGASLNLARSLAPIATALAGVVVSLALLAAGNAALARFWSSSGGRPAMELALPLLAATAFAVLFVRVRYADLIPALRISMRMSAIGLLVYLLAEPPDFTLANPAAAGAALYVQSCYFACLTLAAISLVRPSSVAPVALFVISTRHVVEAISGLTMSTLDIRYMIDMALYLSIFGMLLQAAGRAHPFFLAPQRQEELTLVAFGLHLGNYFWSAFAKMVVGPDWWTWVLENPTQNVLVYSLENGTLPIGHLPWLVQVSYELMAWAVVPINAAILGFQAIALVCVLRQHWLKIASLAYDALHIGIWLFGGLFFWPWIWNNVTILLAAGKQRAFSTGGKAACIVTILLGHPGLPFHRAATLGWFDVSDARQTYFEAVTPTGSSRVPTSFFLSHSYSVSHGYMDTVPHTGHYAHTWWGSAYDYERLRASGKCAIPPAVDPATLEPEARRVARLRRTAYFVRAHHAKMLERQANWGTSIHYARSHHHPSNPWLFDGFNGLQLTDVIGYKLVVESVCHRLLAGRVDKTVVTRTEEFISVR